MKIAEPPAGAPPVMLDGDRLRVHFDRFGLDAYSLFLKLKRLPETAVEFHRETETYSVTAPRRFAAVLGIEVPNVSAQDLPYPACMFDDQRAITEMALEAKRFAVWAGCGLGKTIIELEWSRQVAQRTGGRVLNITLPEIVPQTIAEAKKFYGDTLPVHRIRSRQEMREWCAGKGPGVAITNYEKMNPESLDQQVVREMSSLAGIVLDECFAKGTLVDTEVNGVACKTAIEECSPGTLIRNAAGIDVVAALHCREVPYGVRVTFAGRSVISSPDHPWFTARGWVHAQDLLPGDRLVSTTEAVPIVRGDVHDQVSKLGGEENLRAKLCGQTANVTAWCKGEPVAEVQPASKISGLCMVRNAIPLALEEPGKAFLRSVLLSEMANVTAGTPGEGSQSADSPEDRRRGEAAHELACVGRAAESKLPTTEGRTPSTFRAWGKWDRFDCSAADFAGCTRTDLGDGIYCVSGPLSAGLSHKLQNRLSESRLENRHRGGWEIAPDSLQEGKGRQEGRETLGTRLDGIEILEPGHPDLERLRSADGKLYFYDLDATRHPSFSVSGHLVHNNRLKTGGGKQKWALIKSCRGIEYKLTATATPAPNDLMEFASQASFLEKMRSEGEIIWTFFTRNEKTHRWTVRPHARQAFFEFMSGWSIYVQDPRRYGWRAGMQEVPEPETFVHEIPMTDEQRDSLLDLSVAADGQRELFQDRDTNAIQRGKLSQVAKGFRYLMGQQGRYQEIRSNKPGAIADLIRSEAASGIQTLIWTVFDAEAEILAACLSGKRQRQLGFEVLTGKTPSEERLEILERFRTGETPVLISRASVLGWGINLQHCGSMIFSGWSDSFEQFYQAVRRAYRFGQTRRLRIHLPLIRELEGDTWDNLQRKQAAHDRSIQEMESNYIRARVALTCRN